MNDFSLYFEIGFKHIADFKGINHIDYLRVLLKSSDHIFFVLALCLRYEFADWRKLLILVTAFTIGHSITLALSVFEVIHYSVKWIEFLIPVTIMVTAISNAFVKKFVFKSKFPLIYFLALFFGLIHGMGFSSYLKSLLGKDQQVIGQLLAFNLGLEAGQLAIVLTILIITFIFLSVFRCNRREYILYFSGCILAIALQMALERLPY